MFGLSDPQALLRPWRDLKQFSEELYSMMVSRAPVEQNGPVTIRVRDGQAGLKLTRSPDPVATATTLARTRPAEVEVARPRPPAGRPSREPARGFTPPAAEPEASRVPTPMPVVPPSQATAAQPQSRRPQASQGPAGERGRDARRRPPEVRPLLEVEGPARFSGPDPVRFEEPPQVFDKRRHVWYTPPAFKWPDDPAFIMPSGGGATVFVGKVVSGTGATYQVSLYPDGPDGDADPDAVEVKIPMIDPGETINPGTWLFGIYPFSDSDGNPTYSCQPPVWMD